MHPTPRATEAADVFNTVRSMYRAEARAELEQAFRYCALLLSSSGKKIYAWKLEGRNVKNHPIVFKTQHDCISGTSLAREHVGTIKYLWLLNDVFQLTPDPSETVCDKDHI